MKTSRQRLLAEADATGFRPDVLEKVFHLLRLLEGFRAHPYLRDRLALKGGTAANLFLFDLPRLSVDIDLNYVGAADRETMLEQRPKVEQAVQAVCSREDLAIRHLPQDHAGGKWRLRYDSALGGGGNLEIDLNFMFRVPLWPLLERDSHPVGSFSARRIALVDLHELAAGKFAALLARHAGRDLFDSHLLLTRGGLDRHRLRLAFVVYGAMNRRDWRTVSIEDVVLETRELRDQLIPTVRAGFFDAVDDADKWVETLLAECRTGLGCVLPLTEAEREFLDRLLDHGEIEPSLLTEDGDLAERIASQPWLLWKALNVRRHRGRG